MRVEALVKNSIQLNPKFLVSLSPLVAAASGRSYFYLFFFYCRSGIVLIVIAQKLLFRTFISINALSLSCPALSSETFISIYLIRGVKKAQVKMGMKQ